MGQLELTILASLSTLDMTTPAHLDSDNLARLSMEWSPRSDEEVEDLSTLRPYSGSDHHTNHILRQPLTSRHPNACLEELESLLISKAGPEAGDGPDIHASLYSSDDECL